MRNGRVRRAKPTVFYLFHWTLFFLLFFCQMCEEATTATCEECNVIQFWFSFFSVIIFCVLIDWSGKYYRTSVCGVQFPRGNESREVGEVVGPLEHADDLRADIFHTFHTHDMIKLELEMSSRKWQTTRYVDRYIHTSYICVSARYTASYLWTLRVQFPLSPPFTRLNATYDRNISKWISK